MWNASVTLMERHVCHISSWNDGMVRPTGYWGANYVNRGAGVGGVNARSQRGFCRAAGRADAAALLCPRRSQRARSRRSRVLPGRGASRGGRQPEGTFDWADAGHRRPRLGRGVAATLSSPADCAVANQTSRDVWSAMVVFSNVCYRLIGGIHMREQSCVRVIQSIITSGLAFASPGRNGAFLRPRWANPLG